MRPWTGSLVVALAAVVSVSCHGESFSARSAATRPNILLVTIDTWRVDRLRPDLTPNLSALAAAGVTFSGARSAVPLTLPSHTTILTGLLPPAHGVRDNGMVLAESHRTIAEVLRQNGYQTAAFIGAFVLDRRFGLWHGFDVYDDKIPRDPNATEKLEAERPASAVVDAALAWLDSRQAHDAPNPRDRRDPFFIWIHVYDPHAPYLEHERRDANSERRYDGEVAYVDRQIARLVARVRNQSPAVNASIIVAGDHGEGLGDHGERTHGMLLYESTLRVPLFVAGPGIKPSKRDEPVSLVDIAPTILALAGIAPPGEMRGRDLLVEAKRKTDPEIYAETEYPRVAGWSPLQALTDGRWKAIRAGAGTELFDLRNDANEQKNLAASQPATAMAMAARIESTQPNRAASTTTAVSVEAQERLRALGYVAATSQRSAGTNAPNPSANIADWNTFEDALNQTTHQPGAAVTVLKRLTEAHPDAPVFLTTYARAVRESGKPQDALVVYRAAAKRWPTDSMLLHDLAVAAREAGGLDEAVKAEQAALALEPASAMAHNGLGLLAIEQHRANDAMHEFGEATRLDPNNASYWVNLGNAQHQSGDAAGAEQAYRKALDADARSADAANGLGVLLVEANRPAEAVPWFERALKQPSVFVEAQLNIGIALQQSGDPRRAAEAYRHVLASPGDHHREKDAARKLLASLGSSR